MSDSKGRVRTVTEQQCRDGIAAAQARLADLGTSETELHDREPLCHHEWEAWDELRTWRYLLDGTC